MWKHIDVHNWAWEEEEGVPGAVQTLPRDGAVPNVLTVDAEDRDKLTGMKMSPPEGKSWNISQVSWTFVYRFTHWWIALD